MKKKFSVLIILLLIFTFVSCSSEQGEESFELDYQQISDNNIFAGYEFILRDHDHGGTYDIIPVYAENKLDDMMIERYNSFEEEYECTITLLEGDSNGLIRNIASGLPKYADIMYDKINRAYGAIRVGAYLDLLSISDLDIMSGQFGSVSLLESLTWNGELFLMYPPTWANHFAHVLYYVPSTLKLAGINDPHEYKEQNIWTWETFQNIAETYYSSKSENKAMLAVNPIITDMALYSNGVTWTTLNSDGKRVINFNSSKTIEALNWLNQMFTAGYMIDNASWEANVAALINHETAFDANYSWMGVSKDGGVIPATLEEEFRWISFPIGPSGEEATGVLTFTNPFFLVSFETDVDIIGKFCTIMFSPLGENEDDWWDTFERENFYDEKSYNYYIRMLDTLVFDYSVFVNKTSLIDSLFMNVVRGTRTASEALDTVASTAQEALDSYFE